MAVLPRAREPCPGLRRLRSTGNHAEGEAGEDRRRRSEEQHARVQRGPRDTGQLGRRRRNQQPQRRPRDRQPRDPARSSQQQALRQELPGNARAAGAECQAHRQLLLARTEPREQQRAQVRACDEQHQQNGCGERLEPRPQRYEDSLVQRCDAGDASSIVVTLAHRLRQLRARLCRRCTRCEAADATGNRTHQQLIAEMTMGSRSSSAATE